MWLHLVSARSPRVYSNRKTHVTTILDSYCERICTRSVNGYVRWFCALLDLNISELWRDSEKRTELNQNKSAMEENTKIETQTKKSRECDHNESETHPCIHSACTLWNGLFDYLTLTWHNMTIVINNLISVDRLLCALCLPFLFD